MRNLIIFIGLSFLILGNIPKEKNLYPDFIKQLKDKSSEEVKEKLGAPDKLDANEYFYEISNYKFALNLRFIDDKVVYIRYVSQDNERPSLEQMLDKQIFALSDVSEYPDEGHQKGRYLRVTNSKTPSETYQFYNNKKKALHSYIWKKGMDE